jgi:hypothetical protein
MVMRTQTQKLKTQTHITSTEKMWKKALKLEQPFSPHRSQVDEGATYQLGGTEREAAHARAADATRLERLRQVRDQEKLWARFKAREYRASVADHHAELTYQLHEGWLKARNDKQRELEQDYSSAVMGVGRAQRDAATLGSTRASRKQDDDIAKFDEDLTTLERFEVALGREYERLDELGEPHFAARDRRDGARKVATDARDNMREQLDRTADLRERVKARRDLEASLRAETMTRVAAPCLRPDAFRDTHFNDLVVNAAGVGVGVVRTQREGPKKSQAPAPTTAAAFAAAGGGYGDDDAGTNPRAAAAINRAAAANSAFDRAYSEERRLAESRDADLRKLRALRAKEAERSNAAAVRVRVGESKKEMEKKLDDEARAECAAKIAAMRAVPTQVEGGGGSLVHAPLIKTWREKKMKKEALAAFEEAFQPPIVEQHQQQQQQQQQQQRRGRGGRDAPTTTIPAGTKGVLPTSPGQAGAAGAPRARPYFDDAAPFDDVQQQGFAGMFDAPAEEARYRSVSGYNYNTIGEYTYNPDASAGGAVDPLERVLAMAATAVAATEDAADEAARAWAEARTVPGGYGHYPESGYVGHNAAERLAKHGGLAGATMEEVAAIIAAGDRATASPYGGGGGGFGGIPEEDEPASSSEDDDFVVGLYRR